MNRWPQCARGRIRKRSSGMNKVEAECNLMLLARKQAGEILWWQYEGIKLRLADNDYYTPDFDVMLADGLLEFWEIKVTWGGGRVGMREDAWQKLKIAAETYPFVFRLVVKTPAGWDEKII